MAQHLLIQVRINAYKQHTQANTYSIITWHILSALGEISVQTAWRDLLVDKRQALVRPTVLRSIAWRSTPCRQAPRDARTSLLDLSPDSHTHVARHYISRRTLLVLAPKLDWLTTQSTSKIPEIQSSLKVKFLVIYGPHMV